jgi:hypothetical protein
MTGPMGTPIMRRANITTVPKNAPMVFSLVA